jgi:hypothetical protein
MNLEMLKEHEPMVDWKGLIIGLAVGLIVLGMGIKMSSVKQYMKEKKTGSDEEVALNIQL